MRLSLTAPLAVIALSACQGLLGLVGNGTVVSQTRELGAFKRVEVSSALTAHITTGARAVSVRADENLLPYLETVVEGDTLVARVKAGSNVAKATALEVSIVNDMLEGVTASGAATVTAAATPATTFPVVASGACDLSVTGISATQVTIDASGASKVTLTGAATSAAITASGASTLELKQLPVQAATLEVSGASTVKAAVSGTLTGSVSGASSVSITGTPTGEVNVTGASTLNKGSP